MNIRFFNTYEPVTTFYRDLIPFLTSTGHHVEIIMSKAIYRPGRNLDEAIGHIKTVRIIKTFSFGASYAKTSFARFRVIIAYAIHAILYSLFGPKVDINVFLTQPPLFPLWGTVLSKLRHQPYYCVVQDIYPHHAIAHGTLSPESLTTRVLSWLSQLSLYNAEGVIVIGRCMADRVRKMGIHPERIHFIHNWIDENLVYPIDSKNNQLRKIWELQEKLVVLYAGNIGVAHYFDDILAVAERTKDRSDLAYVFIGNGSRYKEVKNWVENHQLSNVLIFPFQDIDLWAQSYGVGDIHLVTFRDNHTGLGVPSRSYAVLAAGRPIIYQGDEKGEIARMIIEEDVGTVVPCGDTIGLEKAIMKYLEHPALLKYQGKKALTLSQEKYSRLQALKRYSKVFGANIPPS